MASSLAPKGQGRPLWPHETADVGDLEANMQTGKHRLLIQEFDKFSLGGFYGAYIGNFSTDEKKEGFKNFLEKAEAFIKSHKGEKGWLHKYDNPMMLDICIMTILERAYGLDGSAFNDFVKDHDIKTNFQEISGFV